MSRLAPGGAATACRAGHTINSVFWLFGLVLSAFPQERFTIRVGSPPPPPVFLISHDEVWRYHKGTNAPSAGWQTNAEVTLDSTWLSGPGGFGYADNVPEVALVRTPLLDMQNLYSTLYVRRSFHLPDPVAPNMLLSLVLDWDDGFVAWLDGVELSCRTNAPGPPGTEPDFSAMATASHESSRGTASAAPATAFSLGPAEHRLGSGTHVLAILALNQATNSTDFVLVPDLILSASASPQGTHGTLLSIVHSNRVELSGTSSFAGSSRVTVGGIPADFDTSTGSWSYFATLQPGFNRLLLQVFDETGAQLFSTNADLVAELSSQWLGGTLTGTTHLTSDMGVFRVTNSVSLAPGSTLAIGAGCVFLLSPGANFLVTNAVLTVSGEDAKPVVFAPADGSTPWGGLVASGTRAEVEAERLEIIAGHVQLFDGAKAILEKSYLHDYTISSPPILHTLGYPNFCSLTLRNTHVQRYYEILCQLSTNVIEDCLMEYQAQGGDGLDFDGAQPGSAVRRCTVRHGNFTNVDALDMGEFAGGEPSHGVTIESCHLYDYVDKGISMGVQVEITVSNCLIHHLESGIAVKDLSTARIYSCTIASNSIGFNCYNKANPASPSGGGRIADSLNNILWGNTQSFLLANGSTLTSSYSDFQGAPVPGVGNLSLDPLWLAPAQMDYRLASPSPLLAAGSNGQPMGAHYPVGALMASSHPVLTGIGLFGTNLVLSFWADSERSYSLIASDALGGGNWVRVADVFPAPLPRPIAFTNALPIDGRQRFYRVVTPRPG